MSVDNRINRHVEYKIVLEFSKTYTSILKILQLTSGGHTRLKYHTVVRLTRGEVFLLADQEGLVHDGFEVEDLAAALHNGAREQHVGLAVQDASGQ